MKKIFSIIFVFIFLLVGFCEAAEVKSRAQLRHENKPLSIRQRHNSNNIHNTQYAAAAKIGETVSPLKNNYYQSSAQKKANKSNFGISESNLKNNYRQN